MVNGTLVNGKVLPMERSTTRNVMVVRQLKKLIRRPRRLQGDCHGLALNHRAVDMGNVSNGLRTIRTRSMFIRAPLSETDFDQRWWLLQPMILDGFGKANVSMLVKRSSDDVNRASNVVVRTVSIGHQHAMETGGTGGCNMDALQW